MSGPTREDMHVSSLDAYGLTRPDRVHVVTPDDFTETVDVTVYGPDQAVISRTFFAVGQAKKLGQALIAAADFIESHRNRQEEP